ncbi:MAG TPA: hypothetical protein VIY08_01025 [Candidatus Nitrosocosmicus sp.]
MNEEYDDDFLQYVNKEDYKDFYNMYGIAIVGEYDWKEIDELPGFGEIERQKEVKIILYEPFSKCVESFDTRFIKLNESIGYENFEGDHIIELENILFRCDYIVKEYGDDFLDHVNHFMYLLHYNYMGIMLWGSDWKMVNVLPKFKKTRDARVEL